MCLYVMYVCMYGFIRNACVKEKNTTRTLFISYFLVVVFVNIFGWLYYDFFVVKVFITPRGTTFPFSGVPCNTWLDLGIRIYIFTVFGYCTEYLDVIHIS